MMGDLWIPNEPGGGLTTTAGNTNTASDFDLAAMKEAMEECKRMEREQLRSESEFVEKPCSICGRRPIVLDGPTYVVCPHVWDAIKRQCKPEPTVGMPPIGTNLCGVQIEVFDDGPARW